MMPFDILARATNHSATLSVPHILKDGQVFYITGKDGLRPVDLSLIHMLPAFIADIDDILRSIMKNLAHELRRCPAAMTAALG